MGLLATLRRPEDTLADAKNALSKALAKFDNAATHAAAETEKQEAEITALASVITTKRQRVDELHELHADATAMRDVIDLHI